MANDIAETIIKMAELKVKEENDNAKALFKEKCKKHRFIIQAEYDDPADNIDLMYYVVDGKIYVELMEPTKLYEMWSGEPKFVIEVKHKGGSVIDTSLLFIGNKYRANMNEDVMWFNLNIFKIDDNDGRRVETFITEFKSVDTDAVEDELRKAFYLMMNMIVL